MVPRAPGSSVNTMTRVGSLCELPAACLGTYIVDNDFRGSFLFVLKYLLQLVLNCKIIKQQNTIPFSFFLKTLIWQV